MEAVAEADDWLSWFSEPLIAFKSPLKLALSVPLAMGTFEVVV
jgi:hypothetical protein